MNTQARIAAIEALAPHQILPYPHHCRIGFHAELPR
jgi:hypothetical protein